MTPKLSFSDKQREDLKKCATGITLWFLVDPKEMLALLYRLECSEAIVKWACSAPQVFRNEEFVEMAKTWKQSKAE